MKTLIVITGPTASGKSALAIELAKRIHSEIISADSRQMFRQIPIGTAAPSSEDMAAVPHHFVGFLELDSYYSAACFEEEVLRWLARTASSHTILCGGSMMYIDAIVKGIDEIPTISSDVRSRVAELAEVEGIEGLLARLRLSDPEYYDIVDRRNFKRIIHALEIIYESGVTYTRLRTGRVKTRPFKVIQFALDWPREELFERINNRVERMMNNGLEEEAATVFSMRHLNSLNTVGYKELFRYFDGELTREQAIERIKKNTRVYAKKQLTWLKKNHDVIYLNPHLPIDSLLNKIISHLPK